MTNEIPQRQKSLVNLVRASREESRRAKYVGGIQLGLSLLSAVGGPTAVFIIQYFNPSLAPAAKAWVGLIAISIIVIDTVFLHPVAKQMQTTGARIQEQFDTSVYELPWNRLKAGDRVDAGTIDSLAKEHQKRYPDDAKFVDWYPVIVGEVPIRFARLICQGSSARWDSSLRNIVCVIYSIVIAAMLLLSFFYAMALKYDMQALVLSVVMPILPAVLQIWREYKKNVEAGEDMDRASKHIDKLWEELLAERIGEVDVLQQARLIQDELFDRRVRAPGIPETLYQKTRDDQEERMKQIAAEKVMEVKAKNGELRHGA